MLTNLTNLTPEDAEETIQSVNSFFTTLNLQKILTIVLLFVGCMVVMKVVLKLVDRAFRIMIGLKIIKNNIAATCKNIDEAIWNYEYFNHEVYTTWEADELTYHYPATLREVMRVAESKNILPCPTGVRLVLKEIIENVN